ncbi:MAG: valine--tRNA ligase, partial [Bacteroidaceae bacterium]|nr:valine--tRNA ligase [Bacteroidaceae bacterium]
EGESIMREKLELDAPTADDERIIADIEVAKQIVAGVRMVRNQKNIAQKEPLALNHIGENSCEAYNSVIIKMANLSEITAVTEKPADASAFMVGTMEWAVPVGNLIDVEAEIAKNEAQLKHLEGFLAGINKKLANERFVANAPEAVVAMERKKKADSEEKIAAIKQALEALRK